MNPYPYVVNPLIYQSENFNDFKLNATPPTNSSLKDIYDQPLSYPINHDYSPFFILYYRTCECSHCDAVYANCEKLIGPFPSVNEVRDRHCGLLPRPNSLIPEQYHSKEINQILCSKSLVEHIPLSMITPEVEAKINWTMANLRSMDIQDICYMPQPEVQFTPANYGEHHVVSNRPRSSGSENSSSVPNKHDLRQKKHSTIDEVLRAEVNDVHSKFSLLH